MATLLMGGILQKADIADANFENRLRECGKERKSTFYGDLTIAELCGIKDLKDTYNQVIASWLDDIEMISEFYLALNWKIWEHYEHNEPLARVYDSIWRDCYDKILAKHESDKKAIAYFYEYTD